MQHYFECYYGPILHRIQQSEHCESPEQLLGTLDPDSLYADLRDGAMTLLNTNSGLLSTDTRTAVDSALNRAAHALDAVRPLRDTLIERLETQSVDTFVAGAFSEETGLGAAIGSFVLPGIGTMIGSAVGGWFAGKKIEQELEALFEQWSTQMNHFYETVDADWAQLVAPAIERDLSRHQQLSIDTDNYTYAHENGGGFNTAVSVIAVVAVLCTVGYFMLSDDAPDATAGSASVQNAIVAASNTGSASPPKATPSNPQAELRSILERWAVTQRTVDFSGYSSLYSQNSFVGIKRTKSGKVKKYDYSSWLKNRKSMFKPGLVVHVRDHNFLEVTSDSARIRVTQYWQSSSGRYADQGPKEFRLKKENGAWRITSEDMLSSKTWDGRLPD